MPLKVDSLNTGSLFVNGTEIKPSTDSSGLISTAITLSSSQVLNLNSSPVTLIPAPTLNKGIVVISAHAWLTFAGTPYIFGGPGTYLRIKSPNSEPQFLGNLDGFLNSSSSCSVAFFQSSATNTISNEKLQIDSNAGIFNGNSPITVYLTYKIIDLSFYETTFGEAHGIGVNLI